MNRKITQRILLVIVLLVCVIGFLVYARYIRPAPAADPGRDASVSLSQKTSVATSTEPAPEDREKYTDSYVSGFEADLVNVSYVLSYKPSAVSIRSSGSYIWLKDRETGFVHTVQIFYNGAAGFSSSQHFWEEMGVCRNCTRMTPTIDISGAKDLIMFGNNEKEWIVYTHEPGFVLVELVRPNSAIKEVVKGLLISTAPASHIPDATQFALHFIDADAKPSGSCTSTVAVDRYIQKTPAVATEAVQLLLQGPRAEETERGLVSVIPEHTWLNTLTIANGEAVVDVSEEFFLQKSMCHSDGAIAQIRHTLLQFDSVKRITIE